MMYQRRCVPLCGLTILIALSCGAAEQSKPQQERTRERRSDREVTKYDVLQQVHLPVFADLLVSKLEAQTEKDLSHRKPAESDEEFQIREAFTRAFVSALSRCLREVEDVKLGWKLDRQQQRSFLDLDLSVQRGTTLARQLSDVAGLETRFAGFLRDNAAFQVNWLGQTPATEAEAYAKAIDAVQQKALKDAEKEAASDEEKRIRKEIVTSLFAVFHDTAASGRSDGALSIQLDDNRITLVAGGYISDGARLEQTLKPIGQYLQSRHPAFATLKLDAENYEGVNMHTLSIPAPPGGNREKFIRIFGEQLELVVGFGKEGVYFAAGREALPSLKQALDNSRKPAKPASPLAASLAVKPVADFVAAVGKGHDQMTAQEISQALAGTPGKSQISLTTLLSRGGITFRLQADEGILRWIGRAHPKVGKLLLGQE